MAMPSPGLSPTVQCSQCSECRGLHKSMCVCELTHHTINVQVLVDLCMHCRLGAHPSCSRRVGVRPCALLCTHAGRNHRHSPALLSRCHSIRFNLYTSGALSCMRVHGLRRRQPGFMPWPNPPCAHTWCSYGEGGDYL